MDTIQHDGEQRRATYPPNWDDLRRQVLERADYRCEGSTRYPDCRAENGRPHPVTGRMVVLAAAHLYDDDEDTRDIARLRCLCQRCHTAYDADLHMRRAAENRATKHAGLNGPATGADGGRRISVYEASVRAATVEVKALVVTGKQVTLSVFRQLQQESLLDSDAADVRGIPWGKVNYFWGDCKPDHLHIVWQKGDELRRDCVHPDPPASLLSDPERLLRELSSIYVHWCIARGDEGYRNRGLGRHLEQRGRTWYQLTDPPTVQVGARSIAVPVHGYVRDLYCGEGGAFGASYHFSEYTLRDFEEKALRLADGYLETWGSPEEVYEGMCCALEESDNRRAVWRKQYDALAALDQLFIAV